MEENILKQIEELNNQKEANQNGEWLYVDGLGIVWHSTEDKPPVLPTTETPKILKELVEWGSKIDFDSLPQNSVVLIKLNVTDPMHVQMMQRSIAQQVLNPRIEILKEKRICILFMQTGDDISVMTEEEMLEAGWEKKEKSRIIIGR